MITFDSPRIQRFGSAASRRGATVIDQGTATSFCAPPRPPAGPRPPGAGDSGSGTDPEAAYNYEADLRASNAAEYARTHPAPTPHRATPPPAPAPATTSPPGPAENPGTMLATFVALGVVGGLFLWVTSGPQMARVNPRERRPIIDRENDRTLFELQQDIVAELHRTGLWTSDIRTGTTNQGHFLVQGHAPDGKRIGDRSLHKTRLGRIAKKHGYYLDLASSTRDIEFGYANLEPWEKNSSLEDEVIDALEFHDGMGVMTKSKSSKPSTFVLGGVSVAHSKSLRNELERIAKSHQKTFDIIPEKEFGLATIVFAPISDLNYSARHNSHGLRYDDRKGLWIGADSRTLYHVTDTLTGATSVRDGHGLKGVGPNADIRLATRGEADAAGWPAGWTVAASRAPGT